jgi:hypothetical protein
MSTAECLWDDRFRIGNAVEVWLRFRFRFRIFQLRARYRLSGRVAKAMLAGSAFPPVFPYLVDRMKSPRLLRPRSPLRIPGLSAGFAAISLARSCGTCPASCLARAHLSRYALSLISFSPRRNSISLDRFPGAAHRTGTANKPHVQRASSGLSAARAQEDSLLPSHSLGSGGWPETAESSTDGLKHGRKYGPDRDCPLRRQSFTWQKRRTVTENEAVAWRCKK